jgi:hypothetical protein
MSDDQPTLSELASEAYRKQMDHIHRSVTTNRTGWTLQQWTDDAREQFDNLDGTVRSLVNGHVTALLREIDLLKLALSQFTNTIGYVTVSRAVHAAENEPLTPYTPVTDYFRK